MTTYNGHYNIETWNTVLWLYNDSDNYDALIDWVSHEEHTPTHNDVEVNIRNIFGDYTPDGHSLNNVNWSEMHTTIADEWRENKA